MNQDFKTETDYIDVVSENKKEMRIEIAKTIFKTLVSIVFVGALAFGAYIGIKNLIPKIKDSKILSLDPVENGTSENGTTNQGTGNTAANQCFGTYQADNYTYIINDDGTYSAMIGETPQTGTYTHTGDVFTFSYTTIDGNSGSNSYDTDSNCSYIIVDGYKLIKK